MELNKIVKVIPFILLIIISINTWYKFFTHVNVPILEHYFAIIAVVINIILYFVKYKYGILLTGIILIFGIFGLLVFMPVKSLEYYGITISGIDINTPYLEWKIFLILLLYLVINASYIWNLAKRRG